MDALGLPAVSKTRNTLKTKETSQGYPNEVEGEIYYFNGSSYCFIDCSLHQLTDFVSQLTDIDGLTGVIRPLP
ncbi:hypothetical protein [Psychrobacter namhaensis]|jgi:hypothetical protein|uniref:Uncharacterized protein n=1 Tax=Psychrobacter namhaensis TaxID=292734 RepID=A0ABW8LC01_9GAMM